VLIPLTVLAVVGIEEYARRWKPLATIWLLIVVGASVLADVQAFRRPREDWGAMTAALRRGATEQRGCVLLAPARSLYLYRFYDAEFTKLLCDPAGDPQKSILLALSPYESAAEYRAALDRLQPKGWKAVREESFQGPKIIWLSKEK